MSTTLPTARPAAGPPSAPPSGRLPWADVAKGACIVLVVLWHVVLKHYQQIDWDVRLPVSGAWGTVNEQLVPLRMPLFFTISGLFAVRAVERSWSDLLRRRVGRFAALYLLWVLVETVVLAAAPDFPTAHARTPVELLAELTISPTNLWYLLALALYSAVAKACRRVPTAWLLGAAFVLSAAAAAHLIPNAGNRWQVLQNLAFFLVGVRFAPGVERFAARPGGRRLAALVAVTAAALGAVAALHAQSWIGVRPVVSLLSASVGIAAAAATSRRLPRTASRLAALGRRTLPVYVLHLPVLAVLDAVLRGPLQHGASRSLLLAAAEPVLVTAAVVATSLLVDRLLQVARLGRLFDPLRPLARPQGRDSRPGPPQPRSCRVIR